MSATCEYLVRDDDRRLRPCGAPAAWRTPRGMELCEAHHQQRQEARERLRARADFGRYTPNPKPNPPNP